ncbi:gluconokinase [Yoonia sp. F2084L]|uniref:gluconokinase n=1 Tax=Yoonia sp. F2084L TaxID=2926419 RepID=UPI001FF1C98F|nr:gluconokinase [Yoonia sp. F2084L]MCK0096103.1 gluconokinase [Yoonia sp. F2084L]
MHGAIMVMGVSGCGKSTVGAALAAALGGVFVDGDDYHPQTNVDHMAAGYPLTDDMRWPWLDELAVAVNVQRQRSVTVFACSALKKSYRDHLRTAIPDLKVAYLDAPYAVVAARLSQRQGHYMPASLLDNQFATLEVPQNATTTASIDQPVAQIVAALRVVV